MLRRLRWQLTLSHLIAIAFTLVSMVAAIILIGSSWIARQGSTSGALVQNAQIVASAVEGLVLRDLSGQAPAGEAGLSAVLRSIASGDLRLQEGVSIGPAQAQHSGWFSPGIEDLTYIAVIGRDGQMLGSSDPSGANFNPPEASEWTPLLDAALSGQRDPDGLAALRPRATPAALAAYPIPQAGGRPAAAVLVGQTTLPPSNGVWGFGRALVFFSAASIAVLAGSLVFALASSALVGYLLSRRLVGRLERLGQAAEDLAAGDLDRRVEEGPADEVGQLARRFNVMAGQLSRSVAELEAEKKHAQESLRTKRELVANVSHELRTPLASIRGHVESLLMRGGSERKSGPDYLNVIYRESEQLSRLIDDLFMLSTAEAGALPLTIDPVDLAGVIEEVAGSMRSVARSERQVTIVTEVDSSLGPALADRQRVAQVLGNLMRNALRHTPEGGLVAVRARRSGDSAVVSVEDTGTGIPPEQLAHVFERFYRGDASRDRASGGAGLGLAIVRELVNAMGGEVSAESVAGQGSRFSFTLPLADGAAATWARDARDADRNESVRPERE